MYSYQRLMLALWLSLPSWAGEFDGAKALEWTRRAVELGPRPAGSPAIAKLQGIIRSELASKGWQVTEDAFVADTPAGKIAMRNVVGRLPGTSGKAIVFSGHYDTKLMSNMTFVGANDGGASTGWLLEMARALPKVTPRKDEVILVFFDGEEAIGEWSDTNGIYGSKHLAARWAQDKTMARVKAMFNVDMIGDKELRVLDETNSSPSLRRLLRSCAKDLGYGVNFPEYGGAIDDDHMPFVKRGANAVDLIDFDYGPAHSYWHTAKDTLDKLSAKSLQIVGDVLIEVFRRLQ